MLSGRNYIQNDFTSVSSKGCSVVDYCIISHDQLNDFQYFKVVRASELIKYMWCFSLLCRSSIESRPFLSGLAHFMRLCLHV